MSYRTNNRRDLAKQTMSSTLRRRKQATSPAIPTEDHNPALVQTLNYLKFSAKYRRPLTMVPHYARTSSTTGGGGTSYIPTIKPPYNNASMDRFEDCFRSDKLIQNAIVKRVELVIGQHGKIVMDTTEEFDNADDRAAALEKVQNNQQYQDARKAIQKLHIKPSINFHTNLKAAVVQAKVYGRSATEEVGEDDQGLPEALHVLNSKRLAQPEIDPASWRMIGVHYLDLLKGPTGQDDILPAENLIYFTNRDFHVSPGSLYYGLSELEGIVDGSDSTRIAKQEDIKEIMKSNWAPFLIMKFVNPNISVQQMQEVVNGISPGLPFAHKQDIQTEIVNLQGDLKNITEAVDFLNRESLRELGVPAFIGGYEQIANYANSQQVLLAYKEIELEADRTWIKDVIQQQWLNKLFYQLLDIDPETDSPEVKLSYEFEDVSFETDLDKINAALLLFDRQLISGEKVLKIAGYEDSIEEYKLLKEQKDQQRLLMLQRLQKQPQQQGNQQQQDQQGMAGGNGQDQQSQQQQIQNPSVTGNPQSSTSVKKGRQGSVSSNNNNNNIDLYQKFADTLDAIAEK